MTGLPPTFRSRRFKVAVISSTDAQGQVHPLSFTWRSQNYVISTWGRRWQAADGEHFLVMTAAGRMFELIYRSQDGDWFLRRAVPAHSTV